MENLKNWIIEQINHYQNSMGVQEKARLMTIQEEIERMETKEKHFTSNIPKELIITDAPNFSLWMDKTGWKLLGQTGMCTRKDPEENICIGINKLYINFRVQTCNHPLDKRIDFPEEKEQCGECCLISPFTSVEKV